MWAFIGYGLAIGAGISIIVGFVIIVPTGIYCLPYSAWLGWHRGENGIPRSAGKESNLFHIAKNATKLYRSWITKQPHGITNW